MIALALEHATVRVVIHELREACPFFKRLCSAVVFLDLRGEGIVVMKVMQRPLFALRPEATF